MLRKLLRYAALSAALCYNACQPPEEDLESQCEGEVLFEDEFDGEELDFNKWDGEPCGRDYYSLNNGILELRVERGGCGLQSRSTYTLDERTLCFEARWKVGEREGTDFDVGLINGDGEHGSVGFSYGYGNNNLICGNYLGNESDDTTCNTDVTSYHTTRLKVNNRGVEYFIDNRKVAESTESPITDRNYFIDTACQSNDDLERVCFIDNIRLYE